LQHEQRIIEPKRINSVAVSRATVLSRRPGSAVSITHRAQVAIIEPILLVSNHLRLSATEHIDQSRAIMARAPQPSEEPPDARWAVKV
jgi:hypothetical protein